MKTALIIPLFNDKSIYELLDSIKKLKLEFDDVIIVNDASTMKYDFQNYHIPSLKVIDLESNQGPSFARNHGVENTEADLLIFVDSDTIFDDPGFVQKHIKSHQETDMLLTGAVEEVTQNTLLLRAFNMYHWSSSIYTEDEVIDHSTMAASAHISIKRSNFLKAGGFPSNLRSGEDRYFFEQAKKVGLQTFTKHHLVVRHKCDLSFSSILRKYLSYGKSRIILKENNHLGRPSFLLPSNIFLSILLVPILALGLAFETIYRHARYGRFPILYFPYFLIFSLAFCLGPTIYLADNSKLLARYREIRN